MVADLSDAVLPGRFAFYVPLLKAQPGDDLGSGYRIHGVASAEEEDDEGETVVQHGIDWNPFKNRGHFNWNHLPGPENVIGEPTRVEVTEIGRVAGAMTKGKRSDLPCSYVEGILYKGHKRAEATWELMTALSKAQDSGESHRGLGYSVEGGVRQRSPLAPKRLVQTVVMHCAVTHEPIYTGSWARMAKSYAAEAEGRDVEVEVFATFSDFVKAVTLPGIEPVLLQALNGGTGKGMISREQVRRLALGLSPCDNGCHDGERYQKGRTGMLDHLVKCAGWEPGDALEHITALVVALR